MFYFLCVTFTPNITNSWSIHQDTPCTHILNVIEPAISVISLQHAIASMYSDVVHIFMKTLSTEQ